MKIIQPSVVIENQDWNEILQRIERKGRVCYKSEDRITDDSAEKFIGGIIKRGHLSVLEHVSVSVKFIVDRGVSHEIVRHRIGAYSQESTRYCRYGNDNGGITVIEPFFFTDRQKLLREWQTHCELSQISYLGLLRMGATPQEARSVLPNSLKTEIWVTYNLREWRHFFGLRADKAAHPQMRQVAIPLLLKFKELMPAVFGDIGYDEVFLKEHYAEVICA